VALAPDLGRGLVRREDALARVQEVHELHLWARAGGGVAVPLQALLAGGAEYLSGYHVWYEVDGR
jgi:hypothetical protein